MRNPWKLSTLALLSVVVALLGRDLVVREAAADGDRKAQLESALGHLKAAAKALREIDAERPPSKVSSEDVKSSRRAKALDLTNAAIVQVAASLKAN